MITITEYAVASGADYDAFIVEAREKLNYGMEPQGGICCWEYTWSLDGAPAKGTGFAQAFIKREEIK